MAKQQDAKAPVGSIEVEVVTPEQVSHVWLWRATKSPIVVDPASVILIALEEVQHADRCQDALGGIEDLQLGHGQPERLLQGTGG